MTRQRHGSSGDHRLHGLLVAAGRTSGRQGPLTIRASLTSPRPFCTCWVSPCPPPWTDGHVLTEMLTNSATTRAAPPFPASHVKPPAGDSLTPEEQALVEAQLRSLGYMGGRP